MRMSFSNHKLYLSLLLLWIIIHGLILYFSGIQVSLEALKYTREADRLLANQYFSSSKYIFYSVQIIAIAITKYLGIFPIGNYLFQLLLNLIAHICFFGLVYSITGSKKKAGVATFLLIICIPLQAWTVYLYTESLFFSLVIFFYFFLWQIYQCHKKYWGLLVTLLLLVLVRPTGMLMLPAIVVTIFLGITSSNKIKAFYFLSPVVILFIILLNYAFQGQSDFDFVLPFNEGHVICGVPTVSAMADAQKNNSVQFLFQLISSHASFFISLIFHRFLSFFGMLRSYYSITHNVFIGILFYPQYLFAIYYIVTYQRQKKEVYLFCISAIIVYLFSVLLTCDDWHSRFIIPVVPIMIFMATTGFFTWVQRRKVKKL